MYFWLKLLHIAAMAVWFTGLFLLPRLLVPSARGTRPAQPEPARTLYFGVMTPAAVATIVLGILLLTRGFAGAWLPAKLALVCIAVLLHVYCGKLLLEQAQGHGKVTVWSWLLAWAPLPLLLAITALAAAKPGTLPPFD